MASPAFQPIKGRRPVLQNCALGELSIDAAYQRSLDNAGSKALIRRIAREWDWALCQPLVIARRGDDQLFVVDGQHRLAAAQLRQDIHDLPCVISSYADAEDEAAAFVALNQQRRPLGKLELFRAALASGAGEAAEIGAAIAAAGLTLAPHTCYDSWRPGWVANIGGIERSWRRLGPEPTKLALQVLASAWPNEVLRYAGTIFPGLAAVCGAELKSPNPVADAGELLVLLTEMAGAVSQTEWRSEIIRLSADDPSLRTPDASARAIQGAWAELRAELMDEAA